MNWLVITLDPDTGKLYSPAHDDGSLHGFPSKAAAIEAGNELGETFYAVCPESQHEDMLKAADEIERLQRHAKSMIDAMNAENERLRAGIREYACTGTDHPCGCYDQFISERAEIERLRAALKETFCPRPANGAPEWLTVGECLNRGECGCDSGAALK